MAQQSIKEVIWFDDDPKCLEMVISAEVTRRPSSNTHDGLNIYGTVKNILAMAIFIIICVCEYRFGSAMDPDGWERECKDFTDHIRNIYK